MSLLIFAYRKQDIIRRKNELNYELMQLNQKVFDLHSYATSIADGQVSMNDLMKAPGSMFNRMTMYMMYSHQAGMEGAKEKFNFMAQTPGAIPQMPNAQLQQQYQNVLFKSLYEQEKEKVKRVEEKVLAEQDKQIEQLKAKKSEQLKMLEAELEQLNQQEDNACKNSAPHYVA